MEPIKTFDKYAIFWTGGKQYQGIEGKTIAIEKIEGAPGAKLEFDKVLVRKIGGNAFDIGRPYIKAATVKATIVKQMKAPKLIIFKFKRRKKVRVKRGHRQPMTVIRIEAI